MQQNPQELYLIWNYIEPPLIREPEQSSPPNQELFYLDSVCDLASFPLFFFSLPLLLHHLLLALCCFLSFSLLETKQRDRKKERKNWEWVWAPTECCVCGWVGWWWGSWGSRAMWGRGLVPAVVAFKLSARQMEWIILAQAHGKLLDAPLFPARRVISQYKWIIAIASTSWQCDWFGK